MVILDSQNPSLQNPAQNPNTPMRPKGSRKRMNISGWFSCSESVSYRNGALANVKLSTGYSQLLLFLYVIFNPKRPPSTAAGYGEFWLGIGVMFSANLGSTLDTNGGKVQKHGDENLGTDHTAAKKKGLRSIQTWRWIMRMHKNR